MILHLREREGEGGREGEAGNYASAPETPHCKYIFSYPLGIQALSLFSSLGVSIKTTFLKNRHFPPPEESAQTWQRFYLFNELKTLHDETEAFQTPTFLFTNPRLMKTKQNKRQRKKRKTLTYQPFSKEKGKISCNIRTLPQMESCMFYQNSLSKE